MRFDTRSAILAQRLGVVGFLLTVAVLGNAFLGWPFGQRSTFMPIAAVIAYGAFSIGSLVHHLRQPADENLKPCRRCEYDLTGNTTGVCPECGWRWDKTASR